MTKQTGGPAFPCDRIMTNSGVVICADGMTLRDYFAAQAMNSIGMTHTARNNPTECKYSAAHAYMMADAMLEARK